MLISNLPSFSYFPTSQGNTGLSEKMDSMPKQAVIPGSSQDQKGLLLYSFLLSHLCTHSFPNICSIGQLHVPHFHLRPHQNEFTTHISANILYMITYAPSKNMETSTASLFPSSHQNHLWNFLHNNLGFSGIHLNILPSFAITIHQAWKPLSYFLHIYYTGTQIFQCQFPSLGLP